MPSIGIVTLSAISIHALREESDVPDGKPHTPEPWEFQSTPSARRATCAAASGCKKGEISIHALREESDIVYHLLCVFKHGFQSTPSARRATGIYKTFTHVDVNFNPRPPRGERRLQALQQAAPAQISIHALREESDMVRWEVALPQFIFQSTPSARRATRRYRRRPTPAVNFNPRPPRGERRID